MKYILVKPFILLLILLSGCAANGPKYSEQYAVETDDANLYVYRPDSFLNSAINEGVFIDDELIGKLQNGSFVKTKVNEGEHTLKVGKQIQTFNASSNEKVFFKFTHGWALFFVMPISPQTLELTPESTARSELNETRSPK